MSVNSFLTFLAQVLFIALTAFAIFDYINRPNPRRRDFLLFSSALGIPLGISLLREVFGIQISLLDVAGAFILFAQPYFLFRLLQYYRRSRPWIQWVILLGMVACWVILFVYIRTYPVTTLVIVFGYSVLVDAYCTWGYSRGVRRTVGTLRRRLLFITISSGLFTLAVAGSVVSALLPEFESILGAAAYAITAISAVLYYFAFIPPRWVRRSWQFEELRNYLAQTKFTGDREVSIAENFEQLCSSGSQAVNGIAGAVVQWDEAAGQWVVRGATDPELAARMLDSGQPVIEQVWQQRQSRSIYLPKIADQEQRQQMEKLGARTWLLIPILAPERPWGVLIVLLRERSLFVDDDLTLLELFAQQSAIVLENNRLIDELQKHSEQLERRVEERTAALSESEERFRIMADSAPVIIWMTDVEGNSIYLNKQWYDFVGPGYGEDKKIKGLGIVHPDDLQNAERTFVQGHQQRRTFQHEYRLRHQDGSYRWLLDTATPRFDQNGEFVGYIGSILDITERKDAEERLRVLHQLSEAVNRAEEVEQIYELALSGLERVFHVKWASILLFDQKGAMHFHAWRGLSEAYREQTEGQLPHVIDESNPVPVLIPDVTKADLGAQQQITLDEGIRAVAYIPLVEQKRLMGKFMIYYDHPHSFTETEVQWAQTIARHVAHGLQRKRAEAKLQTYTHTLEELNHIQLSLAADLDLQELLQMVTDVSTELSGAEFGAFFYNVHNNGEDAYMLYTLSGVPREHFEQFPMPRATAIFAPTFKGERIIRLADVTKDPRYGQNDPYFGLPPGHLPVRSYLAVPVVSRENEVIGGLFFGHSKVGVFDDQAEQLVSGIASQAAITIENARLYAQVKENAATLRELTVTLEHRVEQRTAELERSNRELDQFAYVASHDLKAPLRAINHLAGWIEQDAKQLLPAPSQEHLNKLQARVRRMENLLDDLLAYSRAGRQRHPAEQVDTAELIHNVTDILSPPAGFTVKVSGELPVMRVERVPLETVFRNLIGNAIKHHHRSSEGNVEITVADRQEFVEFTIKDDGPGIEPVFHQRIFEMFQTLQPRDQVEGSGVGLAIVKRLIESRGGTIQVESTLGEGSTFCFTWPKAVAHYTDDF